MRKINSRLFLLITLVVGAIIFSGTVSYGAEESSITGITPTLGPVGTRITITGENFGVDDVCYEQGNGCHLRVHFNKDNFIEYGDKGYSEAGSWTENKIVALIPSTTQPGKVTIRVERSDPDGENFDLTAKQTFTVTNEEDSPAITKVYPQHAVVGDEDEVVITGQNFNDACENKGTLECEAQVSIGDTLINFQLNTLGYGVSWTDSQIVVRIPEDTKTGGTVKVYRSEVFNWGEEDSYHEAYSITGGEVEIHEKSSDAERGQEIADIENEADAYAPKDESVVTSFDTITEALGLNIVRDMNAEAEAEKLLDKVYGDFSYAVGNEKNSYSYIFFVAYNIGSSAQLGAGERAGAISSWRSTYDNYTFNNAGWKDMLKIANGRWPNSRNTNQEIEVSKIFEKIYKRTPNRDNANDDAAVMIMAYGLRPEPRNTQSEAKAIGFFRGIFGYDPQSALDWDVVRAIAYSGATR